MECETYEMGPSGMVKVDKTKNRNLQLGSVVMWGGNMAWGPEKFVLVERVENDWGVNYKGVSLDDYGYHNIESHSVKTKDDDTWHSQHMFLQDEVFNAEKVVEYKQLADDKKQKEEEKNQERLEEQDKLLEEGKLLFNKYAPEGTKAVIVAEYQVDESDPMTDYFHERTGKTVVLGFSKHDRDLFSEMRKHCAKFKETAHMKDKPDENENGEKKTEENKSWWTPRDEHREKWSMGKGYYLKSSRGRGGWTVSKKCLSGDVYRSLTKKCLFSEVKK